MIADSHLVDAVTNVCWAMLLLGPIAALLARYLLRRSRHRRLATRTAALFTVAAPICAGYPFSMSSQTLNLLILFTAYVTYSYLAACAFSIHRLWLRVPAVIIAYVPVLLGYFLGTIGALGLLIGVDESYPQEIHPLRPGLVCEVTDWGWAGSDEGDSYTLYRYLPGFPWVRLEVRTLSVDFDVSGGPGSDCDTLFQDYEHRH